MREAAAERGKQSASVAGPATCEWLPLLAYSPDMEGLYLLSPPPALHIQIALNIAGWKMRNPTNIVFPARVAVLYQSFVLLDPSTAA